MHTQCLTLMPHSQCTHNASHSMHAQCLSASQSMPHTQCTLSASHSIYHTQYYRRGNVHSILHNQCLTVNAHSMQTQCLTVNASHPMHTECLTLCASQSITLSASYSVPHSHCEALSARHWVCIGCEALTVRHSQCTFNDSEWMHT